MPFDVIEIRQKTGRRSAPVSISLRRLRGVGLPACHIGLSRDIASQISLKRGERVQVLVGTGEHKGILRLRRDNSKGTAGTRPLGTGAFIFNLGHIPHFGLDEVTRVPCEARAIDPNTLEITLPDFQKAAAEQALDAAHDDDGPAVTTERPARPEVVNGTKEKGNALSVARHGCRIDLTINEESITFGKKTMDLTTRQAAVLAALLRAAPSHVGRTFIINNAFADLPSHSRDTSFDLMTGELGNAVSGIGLELKNTKGVGLALIVPTNRA